MAKLKELSFLHYIDLLMVPLRKRNIHEVIIFKRYTVVGK